MRRLLVGCLVILVFLASIGCAAEPTPMPTPTGPCKWSAQVPDELRRGMDYIWIRMENCTPEEVLGDFKAQHPNWGVELKSTSEKGTHITVSVWDPTKYTPSTPEPAKPAREPTADPLKGTKVSTMRIYPGETAGQTLAEFKELWPERKIVQWKVGLDANGVPVEIKVWYK